MGRVKFLISENRGAYRRIKCNPLEEVYLSASRTQGPRPSLSSSEGVGLSLPSSCSCPASSGSENTSSCVITDAVRLGSCADVFSAVSAMTTLDVLAVSSDDAKGSERGGSVFMVERVRNDVAKYLV